MAINLKRLKEYIRETEIVIDILKKALSQQMVDF